MNFLHFFQQEFLVDFLRVTILVEIQIERFAFGKPFLFPNVRLREVVLVTRLSSICNAIIFILHYPNILTIPSISFVKTFSFPPTQNIAVKIRQRLVPICLEKRETRRCYEILMLSIKLQSAPITIQQLRSVRITKKKCE